MSSYRELDITEFMSQNNGHGNGIIIKGGVRRGKTTLASIFCNLLLQAGFTIITNIRFAESVYTDYAGSIHYITSDLDYFEAYLKIPPDSPIVLIFDDIQASEGFKSTHVVRASGDLLQSFLIFLGKFESNYIYIAHSYLVPDTIIDGFEPMVLYKLNRKSFNLAKDNSEVLRHESEIRERSYHIPITKEAYSLALPILSKAVARFEFTLDLPALYNHLAQYEIGENLRAGVRSWLDSQANKNIYSHLEELSQIDIYMALTFKKGELINSGSTLRDLFNPNIINEARKRLKKLGYK